MIKAEFTVVKFRKVFDLKRLVNLGFEKMFFEPLMGKYTCQITKFNAVKHSK